MTEVINLNKHRKAKTRSEKEKKAAENRITHGLTKEEKLRKKQEEERASRFLDGHKRDTDSE